jgi:hypothetical protein
MSVITSLTCTPNRVEIVVRTLSTMPRRLSGRTELIGILSPRALQRGDAEGTTIAQGVLDEMVRIGIIALDDGKYVLASKDVPTDSGKLRSWLHVRFTSRDEAKAAGQAEFPRALTWFLLQDPAHPIPAGSADVADHPRTKIARDFGPDVGSFELSIDARVQNFAYWARYLGYAWFLELDNRRSYVPDPTMAMRRAIEESRSEGRIGIRDFLAAIANRCPVIEGGAARLEVESLLPADRRPVSDRDGLSRSTSLAIHSLEAEGLLELQHLADSRPLLLNSIGGSRPVSHVTILNRNA